MDILFLPAWHLSHTHTIPYPGLSLVLWERLTPPGQWKTAEDSRAPGAGERRADTVSKALHVALPRA